MATLSELTDAAAVTAAVAEFKALGRARFLERYGFSESRTYFVQADGQLIDSKPLVAAIWRHQSPQRPELRPEDFSGGIENAGRVLRRLGLEGGHSTAVGTAVACPVRMVGEVGARQGEPSVRVGHPNVGLQGVPAGAAAAVGVAHLRV
jgi:hypothetical protein